MRRNYLSFMRRAHLSFMRLTHPIFMRRTHSSFIRCAELDNKHGVRSGLAILWSYVNDSFGIYDMLPIE